MRCKKYYTGGDFKLYEGKPRKKGVSQQERKDYAEMKAQQERERLRRRAERKGERAERRGEEPIGYRETIDAGGPRGLESAVRSRTPIYQDEYDMLQRAAMANPVDYYPEVGLSGVRQGGNFGPLCEEGNKGAGASIACNPGKAKKLSKLRNKRAGRQANFMDKIMSRLRGKVNTKGDMWENYNPYNEEERARIAREMGGPTRGITLNNAQPSGFRIVFE